MAWYVSCYCKSGTLCYEKSGSVLHAIVWYGTRSKGGQCVHCTLESLQRKCENLEAGAHPVSLFTHCHDHVTEILSEIFVNNTCNNMSVIDPLAKNWTFLQNLSTSTLSFLARSNDPLRFRSISDKVSYITRAIGSLQKLIQIYSDHSGSLQIEFHGVFWISSYGNQWSWNARLYLPKRCHIEFQKINLKLFLQQNVLWQFQRRNDLLLLQKSQWQQHWGENLRINRELSDEHLVNENWPKPYTGVAPNTTFVDLFHIFVIIL